VYLQIVSNTDKITHFSDLQIKYKTNVFKYKCGPWLAQVCMKISGPFQQLDAETD